ncbi:MAG TPA: DUF222 domain-containing protein, partial [Nakamurella sp.]
MSDEAPTATWAELAAGPTGRTSLTALATVDAHALSGADLVDAIVCSEKASSLLLGVQARLMAALAVPFTAGDPMRLAGKLARRSGLTGGQDYDSNVQLMVGEAAGSLAAGEIAAALRIAPVTAGIRVREAQLLTETFTPAREALEDGCLDRGKLRAILDQVQVLPVDKIGPVLAQVLPEAVDRCTSEIREIAAQAVITADPDDAADRHRRAAARREVRVTPGSDAMATLKAFLPADGAVKLFQVSDLLATGTAGVPGDDRGIGARRADALVDLADRLLSDGHIDLTGYLGQPLPDHGQPRPRTNRPDPTATATGATDPGGIGNRATGAENGAGDSTGIHGIGADNIGADSIGADAADPAGASTDPTTSTGSRTDTQSAAPTPAAPGAGTNPSGSGSGEPADTDTGTGTGTGEVQPGPADADPPARNPADPAPAGRVNNRSMSRQGRRPHLTITLSLDTLAGLNDLPALLAGYGSIPADLARSIATSAGTITTALTDPATGALTTTGELTYRPRQAVRDKVGVLTDTCQFPSCRQPVWRCDADHRDRFNHRDPARGGRTHESNMGALCRRHHLLKDHADWHVSIDTTTLILDWTSPTGHTYPRKPRQSTPPDAWIGTAGTTIAEQLDRIAQLRTRP